MCKNAKCSYLDYVSAAIKHVHKEENLFFAFGLGMQDFPNKEFPKIGTLLH